MQFLYVFSVVIQVSGYPPYYISGLRVSSVTTSKTFYSINIVFKNSQTLLQTRRKQHNERSGFVVRRFTRRRALRVPKIIETSYRFLELQKGFATQTCGHRFRFIKFRKRNEMMCWGLR
ncbi:uncharacterized protein LOC105736390 [Apis florea]|uniref:uncharacterized protein LOC105736390 n=1 Tax=Apis florea TaxID=7463 RepID=UPI000629314D|nr:uncharacterized protein LOC105736390 [Apis florea]